MNATRLRSILSLLLLLALVPGRAHAQPAPCCVLNDVGGTAALPPNCPNGYLGGGQILSGLPAGSSIQVAARLHSFLNVVPAPGGSLGGEQQAWTASLQLGLTGTGALLGFNRVIVLPVSGVTHSAPRTPFDPVQSFDMVLWQLNGQVAGDPDFDLLRVTAGDDFLLPSPGHTTLTSFGPGWAVDSFFDITYRVDFVGAPGSPLAGLSGSAVNPLERFDMCHDQPTPAPPASWGQVKALYR